VGGKLPISKAQVESSECANDGIMWILIKFMYHEKLRRNQLYSNSHIWQNRNTGTFGSE